MSDNVFGNRSVVTRGIAAWHRKGFVAPEGEVVSAVAALDAHVDYDVIEQPLMLPDGTATTYKAIVRQPTNDDPEVRVFGVVDQQYVHVSNRFIAERFDQYIDRGIETMGALGKGETFFVTAALPSYDIAGDRIENFMVVENTMTGKKGVEVYVANVRVVCQNTLFAARQEASERYSIVHGKNVFDDIAAWFEHLWSRTMARYHTLKQAYELMAGIDVSAEAYDAFKQGVYGDPVKPNEDELPPSIYRRRIATWEKTVARMSALREQLDIRWLQAAAQVSGFDTGYGPDRRPATYWDLWQAQTHIENHFTARAQDVVALAENVMAGSRRTSIERGFDVALTMARTFPN